MAHSGQQQPASSQPSTTREEYVVRVPPLTDKKKYSVLKFSSNLGIDITQWNQASLVREDNARVFVDSSSEPKFGAGSEFGKGAREEARKKKLGFRSRKYRIDDQPWTLTLPGKQERKFRGQKEGGVAQNADYWIFVKASEGVFDAYPVADWYNFMPVSRYKTLGIDEAEEQFQQRNKVLNQFALKMQLKAEAVKEDGKKSNEKVKKISGKDEDGDAEEVGPVKQQAKGKGKGKGKKKLPKKQKKRKDDDDDDPMASAESDDGDDEGRELDYISSSESSSEDEEPEKKINDRGVDEEIGMRQLIASDEEEEEGEKEAEEQKPDFTKVESMPTTGFEGEENESDSGSDSDDPDKEDIKSALFMLQKQKTDSAGSSTGDGTPTPSGTAASESGTKRKLQDGTEQPAPKKHKAEKDSKPKTDKPMSMEDEVKRYLQRRPLSTTDLVSKFKRCCQGMPKEEIVQKLADILKRLKPRQERRNGVLYFSLQKSN